MPPALGGEGCCELGQASRLAGARVFQVPAHCSLLLTLVGFHKESFPGSKEGKEKSISRRRAGSGAPASLSARHCHSHSWGLAAVGLKSHVTQAGSWN